MRPNCALDQSVIVPRVGAAGALEIVAPASPGDCLARPAQRER
jgi:hypothetical protein